MATKIATLPGVREHTEGEPVELWLNNAGRIVIRAYNECGNAYTEVDFGDLWAWARGASNDRIGIDGGIIPSLSATERDQ